MTLHSVHSQAARILRSNENVKCTSTSTQPTSSRREIDDDIVRKENPFEVNSLDESEETPEQLLSMITFEGSEQLQTRLKALVLEFIDAFATKVHKEPTAVEPMKIVVDKEKWQLS